MGNTVMSDVNKLDSVYDLELLIGCLQELDFFVVLLFLQLLLLVL